MIQHKYKCEKSKGFSFALLLKNIRKNWPPFVPVKKVVPSLNSKCQEAGMIACDVRWAIARHDVSDGPVRVSVDFAQKTFGAPRGRDAPRGRVCAFSPVTTPPS
jgi:hypothetical protein